MFATFSLVKLSLSRILVQTLSPELITLRIYSNFKNQHGTSNMFAQNCDNSTCDTQAKNLRTYLFLAALTPWLSNETNLTHLNVSSHNCLRWTMLRYNYIRAQLGWKFEYNSNKYSLLHPHICILSYTK